MSTERGMLETFTLRKPSRHATRAIARELSLASICVEEAKEKFAIRSPFEELDSVCADAGIASA